jgi:antitoxin component of MazEF toxin-antitoxin module
MTRHAAAFGRTVLKKARRRKYLLKELVRKIAAKNVHGEVASGRPRGKEAR